MIKKICISTIIFNLLFMTAAFPQNNNFKCDYMGLTTPDDKPLKFGKGIISTKESEFNFEISPTGNEMVYAKNGNIYLVEYDIKSKKWSKPFVAPFSSKSMEGEPCFSPNSNTIYFSSRRPLKKFKSFFKYMVFNKEK